ncbi:MAG: DUF488 domain-containing protein [Sulfuricellaceae bacterium]|jgi:uncharacterized protein YeaO (DUF488 family)
MLKLKRAYEPPTSDDGFRVLVDRLWPRGVSKDAARIGLWLKEAAPSDELRKWFGHDPARWEEFKRRYFLELARNPEALAPLLGEVRRGPVTLVYAAKDETHNNAVALKAFIESATA